MLTLNKYVYLTTTQTIFSQWRTFSRATELPVSLVKPIHVPQDPGHGWMMVDTSDVFPGMMMLTPVSSLLRRRMEELCAHCLTSGASFQSRGDAAGGDKCLCGANVIRG